MLGGDTRRTHKTSTSWVASNYKHLIGEWKGFLGCIYFRALQNAGYAVDERSPSDGNRAFGKAKLGTDLDPSVGGTTPESSWKVLDTRRNKTADRVLVHNSQPHAYAYAHNTTRTIHAHAHE